MCRPLIIWSEHNLIMLDQYNELYKSIHANQSDLLTY